jgi:hypothetical protein
MCFVMAVIKHIVSTMHFAEIRELSEPGQVEPLKIYFSQPFRFFFSIFHINQYSKPEFISRCQAILAHE